MQPTDGVACAPTIPFDAFLAVDARVGVIRAARPNEKARRPAWVMDIDFGPAIGIRTSSAQITKYYEEADLIGTRVVGVVNFEPKRVAGVKSEVLVLGVPDAEGEVVLLRPDHDVPLGGRMF